MYDPLIWGNMLTAEHQQEALSRAFIQAVAGQAGMSCSFKDFDYGIDISINNIQLVGKKYAETGHTISIQTKATYDFKVNSINEIVYDLDVDAYNTLRQTDRGSPAILVLFCMPKPVLSRFTVSTSQTVMQHCGYWFSLRGMPAIPNVSTTRILIPQTQLFDDMALISMMKKVKMGLFP